MRCTNMEIKQNDDMLLSKCILEVVSEIHPLFSTHTFNQFQRDDTSMLVRFSRGLSSMIARTNQAHRSTSKKMMNTRKGCPVYVCT